MSDRLIALIVDESKWLAGSMALAFLCVAVLLYRHRRDERPARRRVLAAMSLFFGVTISSMAFGHLLAVTTKLATRSLEGSLLIFYAIGISLAIPSGWLVLHSRRILAPDTDHGRTTLWLHGWIVLTLLVLGIHNLPLAAPGLLSIGYHFHSRTVVGWAIVCVAVLFSLGLFVGSLVFMASGQSFEQFSGMR